MAYARPADLTARFGDAEIAQLADTDGTGTPDAVLVERALADAAAEIDAALAGRYRLPMAPVPDLLVRIACDLAREALHVDSVPEVVEKRAATARGLLRALASGTARLDGAPAAAGNSDLNLVEIQSGRRRGPFDSPRG